METKGANQLPEYHSVPSTEVLAIKSSYPEFVARRQQEDLKSILCQGNIADRRESLAATIGTINVGGRSFILAYESHHVNVILQLVR